MKISAKIFFALVLFVILMSGRQAYAQAYDGTLMSPLYVTGAEYVAYLEKENMEIVRIEYDLVFSGSLKESFRQLTTDWEYGILAFGDKGIKDIDIKLYKDTGSGWELVTEDTSAENSAWITVKPTTTSMYKMVVVAYSFIEGYTGGHYGLIIFHE